MKDTYKHSLQKINMDPAMKQRVLENAKKHLPDTEKLQKKDNNVKKDVYFIELRKENKWKTVGKLAAALSLFLISVTLIGVTFDFKGMNSMLLGNAPKHTVDPSPHPTSAPTLSTDDIKKITFYEDSGKPIQDLGDFTTQFVNNLNHIFESDSGLMKGTFGKETFTPDDISQNVLEISLTDTVDIPLFNGKSVTCNCILIILQKGQCYFGEYGLYSDISIAMPKDQTIYFGQFMAYNGYITPDEALGLIDASYYVEISSFTADDIAQAKSVILKLVDNLDESTFGMDVTYAEQSEYIKGYPLTNIMAFHFAPFHSTSKFYALFTRETKEASWELRKTQEIENSTAITEPDRPDTNTNN